MLKLLKISWSQSDGLRIHSHCKFYKQFKPTRSSDFLDVTRFNFIASELGWPEIGGDYWHDEIRRGLVDLEITDFADLNAYTKDALAITLHGLEDGSLSLASALAALEKGRALI